MNTRANTLLLAAFALPALFFAHPASGAPAGPAKTGGRVITLEQAYDMTLATDQSIRVAAYEVRKANLLPRSALARVLPNLNANGSVDTSRSSRETTFTTTSDSTSRKAGVSLSETLIDFSVFPAYHLGKLSQKVARLEFKYTVRQTLFGVAQAYYNVLSEQSVVAINQQTVDLAKNQLALAQARLNAGTAARIDVARAVASLEEARKTLIQSQGTLETYRDTLSNVLNLGGKTDFTLAEPPGCADDAADFQAILAHAYAGREDYKVAQLAIAQDIDRRKEKEAEYLPSVAISGNSSWGSVSSHGSSGSQSLDGGISVNVPIFNGGQREIDVQTASHQLAETRLNFETKTKSIESELKTAWLRVITDRGAIKALKSEVDANTQNYNDLQSQYQAGTATSLDVQVALSALDTARTSLTQAVYDQQIALRDLQRAEANFENTRVARAKAH